MEDHKKRFEEFCAETFLEGENKGSKSMTRAKGEKVIALLRKDGNPDDYIPKFKHWVKTRGFQLITHSALGLLNILCLPAKTNVSILNNNL